MEARDQLGGYFSGAMRSDSCLEGSVNSRSGNMEIGMYSSQCILEVKSIAFVDHCGEDSSESKRRVRGNMKIFGL